MTFRDLEAVEVDWIPAQQTVTGTLSAAFMLVVTNTGNVNATFQLSTLTGPGASAHLGLSRLALPAHTPAAVLVPVTVSEPGTHLFEAVANSGTAQDSKTATLTVVGLGKIYIPIVLKNR